MGGKQTDNVMPRGVAVHGKSLRLTFSYKGQRCRESLGLLPTKTNIKFAAGKLAAIQHEIKTGVFAYSAHFPDSKNALLFSSRNQRAGIRVGELCEEFKVLKYATIKEATCRRYNVGFNQCLLILGSDRLLDAIYPEDIMRIRVELMNTRAASTCNHYMSVFREFLEFAQQNDYTSRALAAELKPVRKNRKDPDPLLLEEFQRLSAACLQDQHRNIFSLMIYTGLRPGEIAALGWEDVDFKRAELTVRRALSDGKFKLPKTNKPRVVLLSPPAIAALRNQQQYTAMQEPIDIVVNINNKEREFTYIRPIFTPAITAKGRKHGDFMHANTLPKLWEQVCRRAGIRQRTVYQLRHTYACWNLTAHGNVAFIAKQMGHADYTMLVRVYGRWMENESVSENARIWEALKQKGHDENAPMLPQTLKTIG
ncbi:site-specific integrase [Serratia marcescens]|uniref:site-specific integrase n=1 Tax=Serratia marcescens TaxID=615 RepID=UPI000B6180CD|nr:site-specific integrase [Serratia marcescens]ASM07387.1 hypothetical protein BVG91_10300 [Serratia marcescens]